MGLQVLVNRSVCLYFYWVGKILGMRFNGNTL